MNQNLIANTLVSVVPGVLTASAVATVAADTSSEVVAQTAAATTFSADQGVAGQTFLNPVNKPSSWFEYWKPQYDPGAVVYDDQASTAIHEGQHVADVLNYPQLTSVADHTYFPGAGLVRYGFEYRAYAAEGALSSPLTPFQSFNTMQTVNFVGDMATFGGLSTAAGYSIYQGGH
jgi:hypothetical protein